MQLSSACTIDKALTAHGCHQPEFECPSRALQHSSMLGCAPRMQPWVNADIMMVSSSSRLSPRMDVVSLGFWQERGL